MATQQQVHQLGEILQAVLDPNTAVREPAETQLARYFTHGAESASDALYALALIGQGAGAYSVDIRILALVLLRRKSFTPFPLPSPPPPHSDTTTNTTTTVKLLDALPSSARARVEQCLMSILRDEFDGRVRRGVEDVIGKWVTEGGILPELTTTLFQLAATSSPLHRISVYNLLLTNPDIIALSSRSTSTSAGQQQQHGGITTVIQVLRGGLDDPIPEVRVEAVRAAAQVITAGEEYGKLPRRERVRIGAELVGKITQILPSFPPPQMVTAIEALTTIAEHQPSAFTPQTTGGQLVPFLLEQCRLPLPLEATLPTFLHASSYAAPALSSSLHGNEPAREEEFSTAYSRFSGSLNLLVTLCQSASASSPSSSIQAREVVGLLLGWLSVGICPYPVGSEGERHVVEAWLERDDTEEEDDEVTEMQEYGLEAFASLLPRNEFLQSLFEYVPAMIAADDWRVRAAACEAIGAISLATKDAVVDKLGQVLQLVSQLMADPHVRVLFAVADAVGNVAEVFDVSRLFLFELGAVHDELIHSSSYPFKADLTTPDRQKCFEMLKYLLATASADRVVEHAAQALVPLIDASEEADLVPYLEEMVKALVGLLQNRPLYVQQQALRTLGQSGCMSASLALTANRAFRPFYDQLMPELLNMLSTPADKDRRMLKAVGIECAAFIGTAAGKQVFRQDAARLAQIMADIQPWSFIADALGDDFEPWMPLVMGKMLAGARQAVQVKAYQDGLEEVASGWEVIDDQYLLNTSALEDRLTHVQQLDQICVHLGSRLMRGYLDDVAKCCVENLQFKLDESVREAAAGFIPTLTKHAKAVQRPAVLESVLTIMPDVILREETMTVLSTIYDKLHESIEILGPPLSLPPAFIQRLTQATHFHLSAIGEQRVMRKEMMEAGGDDGSVEESEMEYERGKEEEEDEVMDSMGRVLYAIDSGHTLLFTIGGLKELGLDAGV
ncbi:hypothetical protein QFC21_005709 [Naganishia friedmannii]|uniref:Uncharacterized protein n=1 Tax=Naganishia friedmannii TaxID=89922 RepID=A0ACC2V8G1_9TREE|nr:hypothetical protein QFC21_005709 [Naganishia friedmannii]